MKIAITIDTSNAAFKDDPSPEVARILHELALTFLTPFMRSPVSTIYCDSGDTYTLRDINGNTVGKVTITE